MTVDKAYEILYSASLCVIAILMGIMIFRSIKGPQITDRILSVNMINTMAIIAFLILTAMLDEAYLADVALIYALISFVSTLIFASVYIRRNKVTATQGKDLDEIFRMAREQGEREAREAKEAAEAEEASRKEAEDGMA